jgi:hypothetical protein
MQIWTTKATTKRGKTENRRLLAASHKVRAMFPKAKMAPDLLGFIIK